MNDKPPSADECNAMEWLPARDGEHRFAVWHPQWGGYAGKCVVTFEANSGCSEGHTGCFGVDVWHDGDWPRDDAPPMGFHYCAAEQLIQFGIEVLEKQLEVQLDLRGRPVTPDRARLARLRDRISAMIGEAP